MSIARVTPGVVLLAWLAACDGSGTQPNEHDPAQASTAVDVATDDAPSLARLRPFPRPPLDGRPLVSFPGSRISLPRPAGFVDAVRYVGFTDPEKDSGIMVTDMDGPIDKLRHGMTAEKIKTQGMTLIRKEHGTVDGHPAMLVHVRQVVGLRSYLKWFLCVGNDTKCAMVNASFPARWEAELSTRLRDTLLGARWDPDHAVDSLAGLGFRISVEGLQLAQRSGNSLAFTEDGRLPKKGAGAPLFVVSPSVRDPDVLLKTLHARRRLTQYPQYEQVKVLGTADREIDRLEGVEVIADAVDKESKEPLFLYQMMLFDDNGYYLLLGEASRSGREIWEPRFRAAAATFRRD